MSVSRFLKELFGAASDIIFGLLGWVLIAPIAASIPKRRDWIAVIGRGDGQFLDNGKYFFVDAASNGPKNLRIVFITHRSDVQAWISAAGLESLRFPTIASCWFLARCGVAVVDSVEWCEQGRCFLLARARIVQLWHGVGFKRIELDKWSNEARGRRLMSAPWLFWLRMLRKWVRGRIPRYAAVVTTSAFYRDNVFKPAFRSHHVLTTGYPRNAFGNRSEQMAALVHRNVDRSVLDKLAQWRAQERKIVLVVPTFRDTRATPLGLDPDTQTRLDQFCAEHCYEFIFKFHPYEHGTNNIAGRHLHVLTADCDAYPLLPEVAVMVTDYSSIYMDFLLLDRPILFFTPDLEEYVKRDRDIQFDFERMTPGEKLSGWHELLLQLNTADDATWKQRRAEIRSLAFDNNDQQEASSRLLDFMQTERWIPKFSSGGGVTL